MGAVMSMWWLDGIGCQKETGIRIADPSIAMGRRDSGHICSAPTGSADDPKQSFLVNCWNVCSRQS